MQKHRPFAGPALDCCLHCAREQRVAGEYRVQAFAKQQRERGLEPDGAGADDRERIAGGKGHARGPRS